MAAMSARFIHSRHALAQARWRLVARYHAGRRCQKVLSNTPETATKPALSSDSKPWDTTAPRPRRLLPLVRRSLSWLRRLHPSARRPFARALDVAARGWKV